MSFISSPTEKGQGLVEYALIMVLVSLVVIVALTLLGPSISAVYAQVNDLFPGAASTPDPAPEPTPEPTEEPFGFPLPTTAYDAFCATQPAGTAMHIHYNSVTIRYIGLPNEASLPGFVAGSHQYCPS